FQPESVFHSVNAGNLQDPIERFEINVSGTLNVLNEARLTDSVRSIIVLHESPRSTLHPVSQSERNWVSSTQSAVEASTLAFAESFFRGSHTRLGIANLPALIGGGDWSESSLLGRLLHSVLASEVMSLCGSELHLCHALEAVHVCLRYA